MAYLKRETITASETKQPLLGAICPQGSLSLLPKTQALLNFLCFVLPARDARAELPPEIEEPFCIWHFLSMQEPGHRNQIASQFSLPHWTSLSPSMPIFSSSHLSFRGSVRYLLQVFKQPVKNPGAPLHLWLTKAQDLGMLQLSASPEGTCCSTHFYQQQHLCQMNSHPTKVC